MRRLALALTLTLATLSLHGCAADPESSARPLRSGGLLATLVAQNDAAIARQLATQQRDPSHPSLGGVPDAHDIYHAGATSGLIRNLAAAYASPGSRYHRDPALLEPLLLAARFMRAVQHADGTIDLLTTNFHSPPDTGFILEWMCAATGVLRALTAPDLAPVLAPVLTELREFIVRGADALAVGGIHTPNHRWVVSMALARCNALFPDPRYVARIDEWLAEGIDIDADGQFTERSTSIYSPLTDRCLITVARLLDRPALFEPVRRNLEMTLRYLHADGEVATEGSRRQDQHHVGLVQRYHYPYRYMALRDGNPRFAALTRWMESSGPERLTGSLVYFLESPELAAALPADAALPDDFETWFEHSGLVRIRRGELSATILADNPTFFSLHRGSAAVVLRFASAFFGKGQFTGSGLRRDGHGWTMHQDLVGPYYQPLTPAQRVDGDNWAVFPRDQRRQSEVQRLHSRVRICERDSGFELDIEITGTAGVPVAIELGCRAGGSLDGVTALPNGEGPGSFLLPAGTGRYRLGDDTMSFGPGQAAHRWTQLRGALPKLAGDCVYLTGYTPFRHRLRLR